MWNTKGYIVSSNNVAIPYFELTLKSLKESDTLSVDFKTILEDEIFWINITHELYYDLRAITSLTSLNADEELHIMIRVGAVEKYKKQQSANG